MCLFLTLVCLFRIIYSTRVMVIYKHSLRHRKIFHRNSNDVVTIIVLAKTHVCFELVFVLTETTKSPLQKFDNFKTVPSPNNILHNLKYKITLKLLNQRGKFRVNYKLKSIKDTKLRLITVNQGFITFKRIKF